MPAKTKQLEWPLATTITLALLFPFWTQRRMAAWHGRELNRLGIGRVEKKKLLVDALAG